MNADSLVITPSLGATSVEASVKARCRRDELLAEAATVTTVTDRLDADAALPVLRSMGEFLKDVEGQRERAKEPVLIIGRKIDGLAKELTADLKAAESRISRLCGAFEQGERDRAAKLQAAADEEAARIAFEAAAKERAAVKAAATPEAAARASDAIVGAAAVAIAEVRATAVAAPKAAGTQLRGKVCFEVTDIKALHAWRPEMVTMEPNGPLLRAQIGSTPDIKIPGVHHWFESKLSVK